jgi:tetratricopeptide (TPR) repeat protein
MAAAGRRRKQHDSVACEWGWYACPSKRKKPPYAREGRPDKLLPRRTLRALLSFAERGVPGKYPVRRPPHMHVARQGGPMASQPNTNQSQTSQRVRLTVAMIVRDERDVLADSLDGLCDLADEVIVVDTGSTDDTREIARQHGAKVIERPWDDDFSAARNAGMTAAGGDFVLWLDAGERLAPGAASALRDFLETSADPHKVYCLPIEIPPAEPLGSAEEVARIRLVPRASGLRFTGRVLESVRATSVALGLASELLPWRILRAARDQQPSVKAERARRNLRLVEIEAGETGLDGRLLVCRAEALAALGDHAAAALDFHQAIRTSPRGSLEMLEAYYGLLSSLDVNPAYRERQLAICLEALEIYPIDAQLLCVMGGYLQQQNRLDLAARAFRVAVEHGGVEPEIWHLCDIAEVALSCLVATLELQNEEIEAQRVLDAAVLAAPRSQRLRRLSVNLHIKHARVDDALAHLAQLEVEGRQRAVLRAAVRGACLAIQQNWIPAWSNLQAAYGEGCRDPICLRWLAVTLISTGQTQAAEPILHQWRQVEPGNAEVYGYLAAVSAAHALPAAGDGPATDAEPASRGQETMPQQAPSAGASHSAGGRQLRVDSQTNSAIAPSPLPNVGNLPASQPTAQPPSAV